MPTEIELRLVADNKDAIKSVRDLASEADKLTRVEEQGTKKRMGFIEEERKKIDQLRAARDRSRNESYIERYNKLIESSKKKLEEFETAGVKANENVEKSTDSLKGRLTDLLKQYTLIGTAMAVLIKAGKDISQAFAETAKGIKLATTAGEVWKTLTYDIADGYKSVGTAEEMASEGTAARVMQAIKAAKMMSEQRENERKEIIEISQLRKEYNEEYFRSSDRQLSNTERLEALTKAQDDYNKMNKMQIDNAKEDLAIVQQRLKARKGNITLLDQEAQLTAQINDLESQGLSETRRLNSQRTALIQEGVDEWNAKLKAWHDEIESDNQKFEDERLAKIKKFLDLSLKLQDDYDKSNIESLEGEKKLFAQRDYAMKSLNLFKNQMKEMGTLTPEQERMFNVLGDNIQKALIKGLKEQAFTVKPGEIIGSILESGKKGSDKLKHTYIDTTPSNFFEDVFGITPENKEDFLNGLRDVGSQFEDLMASITDAKAQDAQRNREILDQKVSELQQELQTETELYKAGYASNVDAKKKELEQIKIQREKALKEEEKAIAKQRAMESINQGINIFSSVTQILKTNTKLGPAGVILAAASIAAMFALIASAKKKTAEVTKLAHGGHGVVAGRLHSEGGEAFLDHVEVEDGERWGVLSRRASRKYGKVFGNMIDSFNKDKLPIPKNGLMINNIAVQNDGPNRRLDEVNTNLRKIQTREERTIIGNKIIIKKGSTTRIITT